MNVSRRNTNSSPPLTLCWRRPALTAVALAASLTFLAAPTFAQGQGQGQVAPAEGNWVPGRLLVQPRPGLSEAEFEKVIKQHGGKQVGKIDAINVRIIELPPQASEKAVEALLKNNKHVKFAERDMLLSLADANDPYYPNAWHLPKIGANTVWAKTTGANITVAVLDTGVDANHPDLAGKLVPGWNFRDNNSNTADVHGHGTRVAGTVAAATNNTIGVAAVAGGSSVMPILVANSDGVGSLTAMASGLTWAADRGARVANLSFYGPSASSTVRSAAQYMKNKGGLVVVASGNTGDEAPFEPTDTMIVVSATASNDVRTSWSTYGAYVDLAAPGASIWTTSRGGGYNAVSGTSFSAPTTAAVLALMMSANPKLSPADTQKVLFSTARDLGDPGWDKYYGHGRVDAAAAVAAVATTSTADTTAPKTSISSPTGGSTVKGVVPVDVSATDNVGVSRVDLHVNGKLLASDTTSPYGFSWDSSKVADGDATLTAYAYDAAGNYATHSVKVKVANSSQTTEPAPEPSPTTDTTAPQAKISSPTDGTRLTGRGKVDVSASATDDVGVTGMKLSINGQLVATSSNGSLSYKWSINKLSAGTHTLVVEAVDAAGNKGSHSIKVTR